MDRREIRFEVGGVRCAAWLFLPDGVERPACVVIGHGFAGFRQVRLDVFAERFVRDGFAAFVFDYRHFGDSEGEPRQLLDIDRQLEDWRAAVEWVRQCPEVDASRIALWGTSFSGGHVLTVAAESDVVAAVIAQVPFVDGFASARLSGFRQGFRLGVAALRDELSALLGGEPRYVPAVGPPGSLAAMTTPDAEAGYLRLMPPGGPWRADVAARVFLSLPLYRPIRHASKIRCPVLFCLAQNDSVTPMSSAVAAAKSVPRAEVREYPVGHFEIYFDEWFERATGDQIEFLRRILDRGE
ncbi:MAG: alpha/beta hydrolase [Deltaproteobacteria bacterium]|nr:alpha/beta hydrolase [Deltaproteobacteria bacterium]